MSDETRDCLTCFYRGAWTKRCIALDSPKRGERVGMDEICPCWRSAEEDIT